MEMTNLLTQLEQTNIPKHVAFIMDGNGRWAKSQGQHRLFGHAEGVLSVKEIIKRCMLFPQKTGTVQLKK